MNAQKFTQKSLETIQLANNLALENNNMQIEQEHLLYALLKIDQSLIAQLLKKMGKDPQAFMQAVKQEIDKIFLENEEYQNFFITILSFGFKYGIPADCDLVFDVRFLPNPYYIPELKKKTGNDFEVYDYVMKSEQAKEFDEKLFDMIKFLVPNYITEGKNQLVIGIGCTGGKHRSVSLANALAKHMQELPYSLKVEHRDIEKDAKTKGEN